jgi:hypothetical protein
MPLTNGAAAPALPPARPRDQRLARWITAPTPDNSHGVLRIAEKVTDYFCRRIESEIGGIAFELTKVEPREGEGEETVYHVLLDAASGKHSCDCKGHLRWGHRTLCKHIASLLTLLGLPLPTPNASAATTAGS